MSKINGHGGFVVVDGDPARRCDVAEYELDVEAMIDDVTDSGSEGSAEGLPCLLKVQSITLSVAEDDLESPILLGLTEGEVVTLFLKQGSRNVFDRVSGTIVRGVRLTNPSDKARRIVVTCEYGRLTRAVNAPGAF
jgi:hypothetical protein